MIFQRYKVKFSFFIAIVSIFIKSLESYRYETVYVVTAFSSYERAVLYSLHVTNESVSFLNGVTNEATMPMYINVDRCCTEIFEDQLHLENIEYEKRIILSQDSMSNGFIKWDHIDKWITQRLKKYNYLKKHVIASTYEKRDLFILSLSKNPGGPDVVIVGGEMGRDWMSPAILLNLLDDLLEKSNRYLLLDYYNFYIIPIFNPDGYAYSMINETFWTKNRKVFFPKKICNPDIDASKKKIAAVGVNIERNWYFNNSLGFGDTAECSSIFLGHKSLSAEEPRALAEFLNMHATNLMAFISVKGFGEKLITLPYADGSMLTNNHGIMMEIIMAAREKVFMIHNATYNQGTTAQLFCNSADWVKNILNTPIVTTIYLKFKEEHYPHESHIQTLSQEFITIVKEILTISKEIYGPLFNQQNKNDIQFSVLLLILVVRFN